MCKHTNRIIELQNGATFVAAFTGAFPVPHARFSTAPLRKPARRRCNLQCAATRFVWLNKSLRLFRHEHWPTSQIKVKERRSADTEFITSSNLLHKCMKVHHLYSLRELQSGGWQHGVYVFSLKYFFPCYSQWILPSRGNGAPLCSRTPWSQGHSWHTVSIKSLTFITHMRSISGIFSHPPLSWNISTVQSSKAKKVPKKKLWNRTKWALRVVKSPSLQSHRHIHGFVTRGPQTSLEYSY